MKTLSNLVGCSTYLVSDSANNRYNFVGLVECTEALVESLEDGKEVELSEVDERVIEAFRENDVDLTDFTHCVIVDGDFYLTWA